MLKKVQYKICLMFFITGLLIIIGLGFFLISSLNVTQQNLSTEQIESLRNSTRIIILIAIILFIIINVIIAFCLSKLIIYPANKYKCIESGEEVTEERLNRIATQKNQMETILLYMTDGIIAFNKTGEIILINPAAKKLLNIEPEFNNFVDIFKRFNLDINLEKIIYLENLTSTEQRIGVDDKFVNIFFVPFKNEEKRPDGVIAVIQDITEHVNLDNMQKEFVADVSHELKTPITSIMGYTDTLIEGEYDKETEDRFLGVISSEARRMAKLVTDLLTLSRYENNKKKTQKEFFDLGDLVKNCIGKLEIEIKKKNHKVNCFVTANVPPVYANPYDIERVILNILTNSIKYTKENGEIKIYVGFVYNDAYIKIFDNGIGIPENELSKIFERFYRVDRARTREMGGTGLGLSIAKEILDKNGGSINIKSLIGQGTEVVIKVPTK